MRFAYCNPGAVGRAALVMERHQNYRYTTLEIAPSGQTNAQVLDHHIREAMT